MDFNLTEEQVFLKEQFVKTIIAIESLKKILTLSIKTAFGGSHVR
ncbi:MAG TPA: hypothetical protein PLW88_03285 [Syntrophorhabdaceae bacterium]|nr:hypothetical protein [Syntrophorhabdaceae bacterium]